MLFGGLGSILGDLGILFCFRSLAIWALDIWLGMALEDGWNPTEWNRMIV